MFFFDVVVYWTQSAILFRYITTEEDTATEDELFVHITAENIKGVASLQFTLHFDPTEYEYLNFVSAAIPDYIGGECGG